MLSVCPTTRTIVAKTDFNVKPFKVNIEDCLKLFSTFITQERKNGSILQVRSGFKNSFTCEIYCNRPVSAKICQNGSFQFTGCISKENAFKCVTYIIALLQHLFPQKLFYSITLYEVMSNFLLDFKKTIDCNSLLLHINSQSDFIAFQLPKSVAVNCKYLINSDTVRNREVSVYDENGFCSDKTLDSWVEKPRYVTFRIFESGKVIVSGISEKIVRDCCLRFCEMMETYFSKSQWKFRIDCEKKKSNRNRYEKIALLGFGDKKFLIIKGQKQYVTSRIKNIKENNASAVVVHEFTNVSQKIFLKFKEKLKSDSSVSFKNVHIFAENVDNLVEFLKCAEI
jgi:TATA-box binding protein (TBP) (component of TFIID and TFIIIB)